MKIIVCGVGKIGKNLVKYLKHSDNDVVVIDTDATVLKDLADSLDIQTIVGSASHPDVLEQAGAEDADLIVSVTPNDEVNIMSCYMAHNVFKVDTKIARLSSLSFLDQKYSNKITRHNSLINKVICPEMEIARGVLRNLTTEWASEVIAVGEDKMRLIAMECEENFFFANASIRQIERILPDVNLRVVMLVRDEQIIFPELDDKIEIGDEVYFSIPLNDLQLALEKMNVAVDFNKKIIVIGGGKIGFHLLRLLNVSNLFKNLKIIEKDIDRANLLAEISDSVPIICGDILDEDIQEEIGLDNADVVISLMDEELNIISSLLAKNKGTKRTIATIENDIYDSINEVIGIDVPVDIHSIIVSSILRYIRKGNINAAYSLKGEIGEVIEGVVLENSAIVGKSISSLKNNNIAVVYIMRDKEILVINDETTVHIDDNICLFAAEDHIEKVEQLLSVK